MHQQPPKTPLFASTSPANAPQLDSSRALIVYPDPTSTQPSRQAAWHSAGLRVSLPCGFDCRLPVTLLSWIRGYAICLDLSPGEQQLDR
jgi:hypothetical protein